MSLDGDCGSGGSWFRNGLILLIVCMYMCVTIMEGIEYVLNGWLVIIRMVFPKRCSEKMMVKVFGWFEAKRALISEYHTTRKLYALRNAEKVHYVYEKDLTARQLWWLDCYHAIMTILAQITDASPCWSRRRICTKRCVLTK
jgi:hypothetical protein